MSEEYDMLMNVNAKKLEWKFQVYVVHIWKNPNRYNQKKVNSIEMVLQDIKNSCRVENPSFPLEPFCLKPIPELFAAEKLDDTQLLDIIGEVVGKEDPRDIITSKEKEIKRMVVVIADLEVEPLIVVLQFFKPSRWNDKISVQSHFDVSKLHVNPDMKEIHDFQKRYKVEVMAYDGIGSITMLMWDRETTQLIRRQAEQNKDEDACSAYCLEGEGYPPTLDNMMDKKLLFKINVKTTNINKHDQVYTIIKICDDEDIVEKNCPMEFISNPFDILTENRISNSMDVSAAVANIKSDNNSQCFVDVMEDSVTNLKCKTPTRRALNGGKTCSIIEH
ncbi:uncharacterized protein DS421_11g332620 [Arachis hypogaea]|nr:uncharacterized protein DS421_11g332620 [Arachis hypogaea]